MSKLDENGVNPTSPQTITDEQIVTEKSLPRRSFLTTTGAVLVGGAAALVLGTNTNMMGQSQDPDKAKPQDPDKTKPQDPDKAKAHDPDKAKAHDPDKAKAQDPDKPKTHDPDKAQTPPDPDKPK